MWVVAGGLLGVLLQKWIPRTLTSGLSIEVLYQRIPELVDELRERAEKLVETSPEPIAEFYRRRIAAQLAGPQSRPMYFIDITGGIQSQIRHFDYMRRFLSDAEKETLDRLQSVYRTKLELDAHYTLQKALRYWLYAHVPVSIVLLLLVALHVFLVLYY